MLLCKYKQYLNKLTNIKELAKKNHLKSLLNQSKNAAAYSRKIIDQITQFNHQKPKFIGSVTHGNEDITSPQKIYEVMNNYLPNFGPKLAGKVLTANVSFTKYLGRRKRNYIAFKETEPFEIFSHISLLDPQKAVGHDGISFKTIKVLANTI